MVFNEAILKALIVPVPPKLRLTVAQMRGIAAAIAQASAQLLPQYKDAVTMNRRYRRASAYREWAFEFGLSDDGLYTLLSGTAHLPVYRRPRDQRPGRAAARCPARRDGDPGQPVGARLREAADVAGGAVAKLRPLAKGLGARCII